MGRNLIGGVVGGIVLFLWGVLAWVALPVHTPAIRNIQDEERVITVLRQTLDAKGMYLFPGISHVNGSPSAEAEKAWREKYQRGPVGMIMYDPNGSSPMMPMQMVVGLLLNMLSAMLVAWFLSRSTAITAPYIARVAYCGMFGIFLMLASHLISWNWLNEPSDWVAGLIIDDLVGWVLTGFVIATFVRKPPVANLVEA